NVDVPDLEKWIWDDFVATAIKMTTDRSGKHLNDSGFDPKNIQMFGIKVGLGDATSIQMGLATSGGKLFDGGRYENKTKTTLGILDFFEPGQALNDLVYKYYVAPMSEDATVQQGDTFQAGLIAIGWIWNDGLSQNIADPKYYPFAI